MSGGEHLFIEYIKENLPAKSTILEFGSGVNSTLQLSENYKMISIEDNKRYIDKYNSTYIHASMKNGWYDLDVLQEELSLKYDLILVDGPAGRNGKNVRMGFLTNINLFNVDVPIVIHDVDRPAEKKLLEEVSKYIKRPYKFLDEVERGRTGVIE